MKRDIHLHKVVRILKDDFKLEFRYVALIVGLKYHQARNAYHWKF